MIYGMSRALLVVIGAGQRWYRWAAEGGSRVVSGRGFRWFPGRFRDRGGK